MEKLVSLSKRRGFVFQSSEIYGGLGSVWDYGPLGIELKRNLQERWWHAMVRSRDDIEGLDSAILMHPRVWEASGHVGGFVDPLVDCKTCKGRFRADRLQDAQCLKKPSKKPGEHSECQLTEPRQFNLMFKTHIGPVEDTSAVIYLRPETAQGSYVNFLNVQQASRQRVPFGIAQIGKAFRNEITPGNFIFRTREFEQMEMQFFVEPGTDMEWFEKWKAARMEWHRSLGLDPARLQFHQHGPTELAHYARAAFDIEYDFGGTLGPQEVEGIHNRGDFDLSKHQEFSGKRLEYVDQAANKRYIPFVIETACGPNRTLLALLVNAYREEGVVAPERVTESGDRRVTSEGDTRVVLEPRVVLGFHPALAPIKAGVFPLTKKDGMPEMAERIAADLRKRFPVFYDDAAAIGRRYRRQDEAGTPFGITVDSDSTKNDDVTIRFRDDMGQIRVGTSRVAEVIGTYIASDHASADSKLAGRA
jgi:glycyl-tRNA synthetase